MDGKGYAYLTAATTAIKDTIGTGAVPGHADEQTAVVTEIGRPPVLRIRHDGTKVLLDGLIVEAVECFGIVEVGTKWVRHVGVLAEDVELEPLGPPVAVPGAATSHVHQFASRARCFTHVDGIWVLRVDAGGKSDGLRGKIRRRGENMLKNGRATPRFVIRTSRPV